MSPLLLTQVSSKLESFLFPLHVKVLDNKFKCYVKYFSPSGHYLCKLFFTQSCRSVQRDGLPAQIFGVLAVLVEFVWVQIRIWAEVFYNVYLTFVPPAEKSVAGEIVLVGSSAPK